MININKVIADELKIKLNQVENVIKMKDEGSTVPFISRYRKEQTGDLNEIVVRDIFDRYDYLVELEERKKTILKTIDEQGKLTDELKFKIENCLSKTELEDLYLPYKPKRRTKATIAKEKGLEPLAILIKEYNIPTSPKLDLEKLAEQFINPEKEVKSTKEAIQGAADIIAEEVAEKAEHRQWVREFIQKYGIFTSKIKDEFEVGTTKFETYRTFEKEVKDIASHQMLAMRRGETEGIIVLELKFEEDRIQDFLAMKEILSNDVGLNDFYKSLIKDAFNRLMKHSLIGEVRMQRKIFADEDSIKVFESNLRQMLLASPAGTQPTLGVDPGFRTGCKVVALDGTGQFLEYKAVFPHNSQNERGNASKTIRTMIEKYKIGLIAIGNGTASRETDVFISESIKDMEMKPVKVIVSESGASIYSASPVAGKEFPELDVTVRGAISIGRRLQDPLAELVKIDAKSIGVGQYQHDVDQKLLKKKLDECVESCVNFVGVDLNTASSELLTYVSGINPKIAESIIEFRNKNGVFKNRKQLLKVPKFGEKTFEQSAGFLRIRNGELELDNTAVHPESYFLVEKIAKDLEISLNEITKVSDKVKKLDLSKYVTEKFGILTLKDIIGELEKPGRDPREVFKYAEFQEGIMSMKDLKVGMELEGVVTNITNFGCFVDVGVHQDGLVHISEMSNQFVKDPTKIVKVGQVVKIRVTDVNIGLKRIQLSMKMQNQIQKKVAVIEEPKFSLGDLKNKFDS